jgi:acetyl esterase/lipase
MKTDRRTVLGAAVGGGLLAAQSAAAQSAAAPTPALPAGWLPPTPFVPSGGPPAWPSREVIGLWPGKPPGAPATLPSPAPTMNGPAVRRQLWIRGVANAEIHVFRPARPDGSALLSIPGGGYQFVSVQNEGLDVAQYFNALGTTVFVLVYRLPREGWSPAHLAPLQDAQRAMRVIRSRATEFRIDPERLGVLGFSAGGHLAADLITAHSETVYAPVDAADQLSAKPAFAGLIYPVTGLIMQSGSRRYATMLAPGMSDADLQARSPVRKITADTPSTFLVHAADDPLVVLDCSLEWIAAARAAGRPVEAMFPAVGGHGFGLNLPKDNSGALWPDVFARWLRKNGG